MSTFCSLVLPQDELLAIAATKQAEEAIVDAAINATFSAYFMSVTQHLSHLSLKDSLPQIPSTTSLPARQVPSRQLYPGQWKEQIESSRRQLAALTQEAQARQQAGKTDEAEQMRNEAVESLTHLAHKIRYY